MNKKILNRKIWFGLCLDVLFSICIEYDSLLVSQARQDLNRFSVARKRRTRGLGSRSDNVSRSFLRGVNGLSELESRSQAAAKQNMGQLSQSRNNVCSD